MASDREIIEYLATQYSLDMRSSPSDVLKQMIIVNNKTRRLVKMVHSVD